MLVCFVREKKAYDIMTSIVGAEMYIRDKSTCLSRCIKRGTFFFHELLPAFICCTIGILVMMYGQDTTFVDAFYWSIVTGTTVGYGDVYPITMGGKIFTFFILLIGVGIVTIPAGLVASALSKAREMDEEENNKKLK